MLFRMAAPAAILLCGAQTASAEVCDKAYGFDFGDLMPIDTATEFLMVAAGPVGGLAVFFTVLYLATSKAGALFGFSLFLGFIGLSETMMSSDSAVFTDMVREGCAPAYSAIGPVLLATAALAAIFAVSTMRRSASSRV